MQGQQGQVVGCVACNLHGVAFVEAFVESSEGEVHVEYDPVVLYPQK